MADISHIARELLNGAPPAEDDAVTVGCSSYAMTVWPAQAELLSAEEAIVGMFTGAGYGKTRTLCLRGTMDSLKQNGWWKKLDFAPKDPLHFIYGAPHSMYITARLAPEQRNVVNTLERATGYTLTKTTGRGRDGYFDSSQTRRLEMANGVTIQFTGLDKEEKAVAVNAAGLYVDEATMLPSQNIWTRATMRVRDPRAICKSIVCTGTPELGHFLHEEFFDPLTKKVRPGYRVITDSTINNPVIDLDFFKRYQNANEAFVDMQVFGKWTQGQGGQRFAHLLRPEIHYRPMNINMTHPGAKFAIGWDPGYATGQVVVMYYKQSTQQWLVLREIPITGMSTRDVCKILLSWGLHGHRGNIDAILMDPNDANKRKSNGPMTDQDIVYEELGVRPKFKRKMNYNSQLRTRNDVLADFLARGKIIFNEDMLPIHSRQPGVINSVLNFELKSAVKTDDESRFEDKVTASTNKLWKHAIDAIHYVLMHYEDAVYKRIEWAAKSRMKASRINDNRRK